MANPLGNNGGRTYGFLNRPILIDCNFIVDSANVNGLGISSLKGMGVKNVFMHTSQTPGSNRGSLNPNPLAGYALIQLDSNYNRYCGGFRGFISPPLTGSNLAINATALTAHTPYVITAVGHGTAGAATIAPVADTAGSLASTWFLLFDSYGNTFAIWFSVSGVGRAPSVPSNVILVQQSITTGDTAATIGTALGVTIAALPIAPGSGTFGFTVAGSSTLTVTSTANVPLAGVPQDGVVPTGFTFVSTKYKTNNQNWAGVGLPAGVTPAVGASFIATAVGDATGGGSTGTVKLASVSGISAIEVLGDPNLTIAPGPSGGTPHNGGWVLVQFLKPGTSAVTSALTMNSYTPAGTNDGSSPPLFTGTPAVLTGTIANSGGVTTFAAGAPTDASVVYMSFYMEAGSILINGE